MFKRTIAVMTILAAMLCFTVSADAAKSDKWIVYWYVCGTDIETTRIALHPNSDLMSDDPNALILADPDRKPGDASRCIQEVEAANLSPGVKIFMQAGGTYVWGHKKFRDLNAKIDTNGTAYVFDKEGAIRVYVLGKDGNPVLDENGNPVEVGLKQIKGTVLSGSNVGVAQFFLKKNTIIGIDKETGNLIRSYQPVANGKVGRYVYDKYHRNWHPREILPISGEKNSNTDMGSLEGLKSFLEAGQEFERSTYPDGNVRRVLILVDHGVERAGGLHGICSDEYTGNSLSLKEIQEAFAQVKDGWANPEEKPFEVIAFDACVMSAYETAMAVKDAANYMVASQEETVGPVMLGYTGLLNDLSKNPSMSGAQLGKVFCNTYWDDSKAVDKKWNTNINTMLTFSVVDLSDAKMDTLKTAYADFSQEALDVVKKNPDEFVQTLAKFARAANGAEKYPSEAAGAVLSSYSVPRFVDLKGFAKNTAQRFPELKKSGDALAAAVDSAVIYQKRGEGLNRGGGLSVFYPFDLIGSFGQNIEDYQTVAASDKLASETQGDFYKYIYDNVTQNLELVNVPRFDRETGKDQVDPKTGQVITDPKWQIPENGLFDLSDLSKVEVQLDENKKTTWVELDEQDRNRIEDVRCQVLMLGDFDADTERVSGLYLGLDNSLKENWDTGKFESTFDGKWLMLDGHIVSSFVTSDATKKNKSGKKINGTELYVVLVKINGRECALLVSCTYPNEKFRIIGARPLLEKSQTTLDGELIALSKGDVIEPLYPVFNMSRSDFEKIAAEALRRYNRPLEQLPPDLQRELMAGYAGLLPGSAFTIGDKPKIEQGTMPDGVYAYVFEFFTPIGGEVRTEQGVAFVVKNGKVALVRHLDKIDNIRSLELEAEEK